MDRMRRSSIWVFPLIALLTTSVVVPFDKPWPYPLSAQILTSFQQDSSPSKADEAAFAFSCIGEYGLASRFNDKHNSPQWTLKGFVKSTDS
ncbi:hypothetical protein FHK02_600 [Spirosoma sp. LMG 31448]|uniref:Uncharacterized protein n=1 Tax=Spirosoma utsteinense TaxID=2585773 RepID=A0ABR6WCE5_9BACT|nr:hypothetical protein [Spirosoma utsteinense]MBC3794238.1 hypothetical protein [Spirosoma utsteinense]